VPFNLHSGVYTPASGATSAAPGLLIQSAVWNSVFSDISSALTTLGELLFNPRTVSGNFTVAQLDRYVMIIGSAPTITLPASSVKAGPVTLVGAASGIFGTNNSLIMLAAGSGDAIDGSTVNPALTLVTNYQPITFYPISGVGYVLGTP
jgi:hypothetical protein